MNPAIKYARSDALKVVKEEAWRQLNASEKTLEGFNRLEARSADEERKKNEAIDRQEIQRQADAITYKEAMKLDDHRVAEVVLMPEGYNGQSKQKEDLHWKLTIGHSDFLVNARTGEIAVQKMPMW